MARTFRASRIRACIPCLLTNHDRGWGPLICFVLAFHLISKLLTWLSGHHALKCVIDGPGVEGHAPLSPLHDRECVHAYICLEILCLALLVCCCCQNCLLQEFCADRQYRVPTGNVFIADSFISSRWTLYTAGGHSIQPVMILRIQGACSRTFAIFQRSRTVKQRQQWHGADFWANRTEAYIIRTSRGGGCGHLFFAFNLIRSEVL